MKMFLTRLGFNSKMIVNGDISQIDLPKNSKSGLIDATEKLKHIKQIDFVYLSVKDVVRHPVVAEIIKAYEHSTEVTHRHFSKEEHLNLTSYETVNKVIKEKESEDNEGNSLS